MVEANIAQMGDAKRVIVVLRSDEEAARRGRIRKLMMWPAAAVVLTIGLALGYRSAALFTPEPLVVGTSNNLTERVKGGLYALELATPHGQSRWMLEFDAEIVTKEGPSNPLELRNALEDLVITATALPIVQSADQPEEAMRAAMLAIAAQNYPWLIDLYMTRSDIRAEKDTLGGIGRALRNLSGG